MSDRNITCGTIDCILLMRSNSLLLFIGQLNVIVSNKYQCIRKRASILTLELTIWAGNDINGLVAISALKDNLMAPTWSNFRGKCPDTLLLLHCFGRLSGLDRWNENWKLNRKLHVHGIRDAIFTSIKFFCP